MHTAECSFSVFLHLYNLGLFKQHLYCMFPGTWCPGPGAREYGARDMVPGTGPVPETRSVLQKIGPDPETGWSQECLKTFRNYSLVGKPLF